MKRNRLLQAGIAVGAIISMMTACGEAGTGGAATEVAGSSTKAEGSAQTAEKLSSGSVIDGGALTQRSEKESMENTADGEHVITADGETAEYSGLYIEKSGEADGDEADFYGANAAIFATNGATLTLSDMDIHTNGTHANAVFSYGEGTTVNISDSTIETEGNCSGGIMTTGGGTMNAERLQIHTTGNSSAAIRSDRGGGTVNVSGGSYTTEGMGSPVVYSTADITVSDAEMTSTSSQGIVVEGQNSVTLNNVVLTADNNSKNSDKSDYYQAVMIYQSMSGDASEGLASFSMKDGTLTNQNGDIFFVNNTTAQIDLENAEIVNNDSEGVFLRAAAAGWGNEGSNGGQVELKAQQQQIDGDILVDDVSVLNLYLTDGSAWNGALNPDGEEGNVYVEIDDDSVWTLSADSYVDSLTCDEDAIDLNGHILYVNGVEYVAGSASTGEACEFTHSSGNGGMQAPPDGQGGAPDGMQTPPDGQAPDGQMGGTAPDGMQTPPDGQAPDGQMNGQAPDGQMGGMAPGGQTDGTTPPAKPGE